MTSSKGPASVRFHSIVCPPSGAWIDRFGHNPAGGLGLSGESVVSPVGPTAGEPVHLSLRKLLRNPPVWAVVDRDVFVCENPSIVAIAADRLGGASAPLVCTDGMPSAAQRTLILQLVAAGARLRYHGDFDWPGLTIGNFVIRALRAKPWRFDADDYLAACRGGVSTLPVEGRIEAEWDLGLRARWSNGGSRCTRRWWRICCWRTFWWQRYEALSESACDPLLISRNRNRWEPVELAWTSCDRSASGALGQIRTGVERKRSPVLQTGAFNRSATSAIMAHRKGLEPPTYGFGDRRSTN